MCFGTQSEVALTNLPLGSVSHPELLSSLLHISRIPLEHIALPNVYSGTVTLTRNMARVESEFDVGKDLPEFLSSVLDRTEEYISNNETNINDLQVHVVLDRTVNRLSSIAFAFEQDRIEWVSLATAFSEVLRAIENHIKTLAVKPSLISRRECETLRTGTLGRPQFYVSAETLEDLLGLGFSMGKISRMFGVSRWTIFRRIQSYGLQNTVQFSLLSDAELDELVLEYMGRHGFTTGRTYLPGTFSQLD